MGSFDKIIKGAMGYQNDPNAGQYADSIDEVILNSEQDFQLQKWMRDVAQNPGLKKPPLSPEEIQQLKKQSGMK